MKRYFYIKKIMIKNFKFILSLILVLSFISGCGTVKEGFVGTKKKNSDEFLIEKKNPLVLPPDFEKLPTPTSKETSTQNNQEFDIKKMIDENSGIKTSSTTTSKNSGSLDKSILEKIKNN